MDGTRLYCCSHFETFVTVLYPFCNPYVPLPVTHRFVLYRMGGGEEGGQGYGVKAEMADR